MKKLWDKLFGRKQREGTASLEWLEPGTGNPFGIRVLDVRPLTQTMLSTTKNPDIAASFARLRQSDGSDLTAFSVDEFVSISTELHVPLPAPPADGPLFKAQAMEDKWDIYSFDSSLYFARSWTGELVHKALYRFCDGELIVTSIESAPDHSHQADQVVLFLLVSHVLGRPFPNPILDFFRGDPQQIAMYSYSAFGRHALFATEDDVTKVPMPNVGSQSG